VEHQPQQIVSPSATDTGTTDEIELFALNGQPQKRPSIVNTDFAQKSLEGDEKNSDLLGVPRASGARKSSAGSKLQPVQQEGFVSNGTNNEQSPPGLEPEDDQNPPGLEMHIPHATDDDLIEV